MVKKKFSSSLIQNQSVKVTNETPEASGEGFIMAVRTKSDKIIERKLKRQKKDKRNIVRSQQNEAPLKLNRRLRREKRLAEEKAMPVAASLPTTEIQQDDLTCKWSAVNRNVNPNVNSDDIDNLLRPITKRRRQSSASSSKHASDKRGKFGSADDSGDDIVVMSDSDDDNYMTGSSDDKMASDDEVEEQHTETQDPDADAIIDAIKQQNKYKNGPEIAWFDNVDPLLLEKDIVFPKDDAVEVDMDAENSFINDGEKKQKTIEIMKSDEKRAKLLESAIALDCEMVGVGENGYDSAIARVSIVDKYGKVILDKYCKPANKVVDYRTKYSGIRPRNLVDAPPFSQVQREVAALLRGRLLVGHALKNDLTGLFLSHPAHCIRDTSVYNPFRIRYNKQAPSLRNLCRDYLNVTIQDGEHDSVTDARAAMRLYTMHRAAWESAISRGGRNGQKKTLYIKKGGMRKKMKPKKNKQFASRQK